MFLIILATLVAICAYLYFYIISYNERYWARFNVKYCKRSKNYFQELLARFSSSIVLTEETQKLYEEYPDEPWCGVKWLSLDALMIRDPQLVNDITVKHFNHFGDHSNFFNQDDVDPFMARSLFSLRGDRWREMRSVLSPAFTGSKMRGIFILMDDCCKQTISYIKNKFNAQSNKSKPLEMELKDILSKYATDIIASTAFGVQIDSLENPDNIFYVMAKTLMRLRMWRLFIMNNFKTIAKWFEISIFPSSTTKYFRKIINETIAEREEKKIVRPDMLHLLMEAKKGNLKYDQLDEKEKDLQETKKIELDNDDVAAQAVIFFMAGLEGISSLVCFTIYELALNPEIQNRLLQEINESKNKTDEKLTYEVLQSMKYLDMVINESLRKWTAATFLDRKCTVPLTLKSGNKEIHIPKGMVIQIPVVAFHHDPKYFPEPDKFLPERFDSNKNTIHSGTYLPFGIGPRNCIGFRFAVMEAKVLVVHFIKNFEIVPTSKTQIPLQLMPNTLNLSAKNGFWLGFKPRNK